MSSQEAVGQFQSNLVQIIFGVEGSDKYYMMNLTACLSIKDPSCMYKIMMAFAKIQKCWPVWISITFDIWYEKENDENLTITVFFTS
jgi:hypothetical protein